MAMSINIRNLAAGKMGFVNKGLVASKELSIKLCVAILGISLLSGCSTMEDLTGVDSPELPELSLPKFENPFKKPEPKLPGERIPVMSAKRGGAPELDVGAATAITALPVITANSEWTQPGGLANNAPGHLAFSNAAARSWNADAGRGSNKRSRVVASPIVYGGRVFTLDARGKVSAFSQSSGSLIWGVKMTPSKERDHEGYGGGLAIDGGRLYVATGFGKVHALNPSTGKEIWVQPIGEPVRASPTATNGKVFTTTALGSFICLNAEDGSVLWRYQGLPESASLLTNASPAVSGGIVVAPYPSGEVVAFDVETGTPVWTETLSRAQRGNSLSALRNASRPVISNNIVYAVGHGGRMTASDLRTGERLWSHNIQGVQAPWVAGNTVYVVDVSGELMALTAKSGKLLWRAKLPGGGRWSGPVLAGGQLWLVSTKGMLVGVNGKLGSVTVKKNIGSKLTIAPVVAGGRMFLLTDKAKLLALR